VDSSNKFTILVQCIQQGFADIRLTQSAIAKLAKAVGREKYKVLFLFITD
jgi:hypothetical protein